MSIDQGHRKSDHVEVSAVDAINEARRESLDGVSAGFVHRLAALDVGREFLFAELDEMNAGDSAVDYFLRIAAQADAGDYLMVAAREQTEHAQRVGVITRFFEDVLVNDHYGVARENRFASVHRNGECFLLSEPADIRVGRFIRLALFRNIGSADSEWNACSREDLLPTRRGGCQNQHSYTVEEPSGRRQRTHSCVQRSHCRNTLSRTDECKVGRTPWSAADAHVGLLLVFVDT